MIKVEHSVFALPFALVGMMWGSLEASGSPWPGWRVFGLIVLAMVAARSTAMAFNRIVDRDVDAKNPRTQNRALPKRLLSVGTASTLTWASAFVFVLAAASLNTLALALSPVALLVTLGYSWCKRFTPFCHFVLGLSLGIAPAAAWIAVSGSMHPAILPMVLAVALWTAGFDILYSLQDEDFDKTNNLRSLPAWIGRKRAMSVSRLCHVGAVGALCWSAVAVGGGPWLWAGVAGVAMMLAFEQSLVKVDDLSRVNMAFFTVNGFVSIGFFLFAWVDVVARSR